MFWTRHKFDEASYLLANPDVAAEVSAGRLRSGKMHWRRFGRKERRPLLPPPPPRRSRREILLDGLSVASTVGLEIGPLASPLVTKDEGPIHYVDHADTEALQRKYPTTEVDHDKLVDVDFVWGERSLADCLGAGHRVGYVLASHVVEHVPDLVTWLQEIATILEPGGTLRLAVPDRRFTFDILRRESTLADALDAYLRRARVPLPRAILDHFLNVTHVNAGQAWRGELNRAELQPIHDRQWAFRLAEQCFRTGQYQDTHCWVFTPHSFAALGAELADIGVLNLRCLRIEATEPGELEFFACLQQSDDQAETARSWHAERRRLTTGGGPMR